MTDDQALDKVLRGGARSRGDGAEHLRRRVREGAVLALPPVDDAVEDNRWILRALHGLAALHRGDDARFTAVLAGAPSDHRRALLLDVANGGFFPPGSLDAARALLADADPQQVFLGYYLLARWLRDGREPFEELLGLVWDGRVDRRKTTGAYRTIGAQCEAAILLAAGGDGSARLAELLTPRLADREAATRTLAARFLTRQSLATGDAAALGTLLCHANATVRKAAADTVSTRDPVVARRTLLLAVDGDLPTRHAVADAIAAGMEPGVEAPDEVNTARAALFAADPGARLAAIHRFPAWSTDLVDLRTAAPHLGLALSDPDPRVREEATLAVYALGDAQGPVHVVQALRPLVERALPAWDGEAAARLRSALRALG